MAGDRWMWNEKVCSGHECICDCDHCILDCYDIGFYDLSGEKIPADKLVEAFDMAIEALQVEIVRCSMCKYYNWETKGCIRNPSVEKWENDDFCSYGERIEDHD